MRKHSDLRTIKGYGPRGSYRGGYISIYLRSMCHLRVSDDLASYELTHLDGFCRADTTFGR